MMNLDDVTPDDVVAFPLMTLIELGARCAPKQRLSDIGCDELLSSKTHRVLKLLCSAIRARRSEIAKVMTEYGIQGVTPDDVNTDPLGCARFALMAIAQDPESEREG